MLVALRSDLNATLRSIDEQLAYRHASKDVVIQLLDASGDPSAFNPSEFDRLIGQVMWTGWVDVAMGAQSSLLQGGKLSLIQNEALQREIAELPHLFESMSRLEILEATLLERDLLPFLYSNSSLPQIVNTWDGQPGTGLNSGTPSLPNAVPRNHAELLQDPVFINMLTIEYSDHGDVIWQYGLVVDKIRTVIQIIDGELRANTSDE